MENDTGVSPQHVDMMAAIEKLTKHVKHLERRIDIILTGFLFLVLLALVAPLIVFALGPDAIRKVPILRSVVAPAATPVNVAPAAPKPDPGSAAQSPAAPVNLAPTTAPEKPGVTVLPKSPANDENATGPRALTPKKPPTH